MALVVDASVALKWVLDEDGADAARALLQTDDLIAPEFLLLECANVLVMTARKGAISSADISVLMTVVEEAPVSYRPFRPYLSMAKAIAEAERQTVYDSLYVAMAALEVETLVTADRKLATALGGAWPVRLLEA